MNKTNFAPAADWLVDEGRHLTPPPPNISRNTSASLRSALGVMPSQQNIVLERFFDDTGSMQW